MFQVLVSPVVPVTCGADDSSDMVRCGVGSMFSFLEISICQPCPGDDHC